MVCDGTSVAITHGVPSFCLSSFPLTSVVSKTLNEFHCLDAKVEKAELAVEEANARLARLHQQHCVAREHSSRLFD